MGYVSQDLWKYIQPQETAAALTSFGPEIPQECPRLVRKNVHRSSLFWLHLAVKGPINWSIP